MNQTIKLVIVDSQREFREALELYLIKHVDNIEIIIAETRVDGVNKAIKQNSDFVIMDIQFDFLDGVVTSEEIKKALPNCVIIALTLFSGDILKNNYISKGIDEVIGKNGIEINLLPVLYKYSRTSA